jgi:UDPglucose 6-dehydrogenase
VLSLGVIGCGNVGFNTLKAFHVKGYKVKGFDIDKSALEKIAIGIDEGCVAKKFSDLRICDIIFECVPTDPNPSGRGCDLSILFDVVKKLSKLEHESDYCCALFVQRSTCPPGTAAQLSQIFTKTDYAVNPSFVSKANIWGDSICPERIAIGGSEHAIRLLEQVYSPFKEVPLYVSKSWEAIELLKYLENVTDAVLISLWNEYLEVADALQISREDFVNLMVGITQRKRFATIVRVPGKAFGLWCLPKDTCAFSEFAKKLGCNSNVIEAAIKTNEAIKSLHGTNTLPTKKLLEERDNKVVPSEIAKKEIVPNRGQS